MASSAHAKGIAPTSASCDAHAKSSPAWQACIANARTTASDKELFYAGYWLAKSGRYSEALAYLNNAQVKDARVLTYIGYATRKLGRVDDAMDYYAQALDLNPDYTVARSYLGEAHLVRGERVKAGHELNEIANRCGTSCAEYKDLALAIARFDAKRG